MTNYQRENSTSNSHVEREFERIAKKYLNTELNVELTESFPLEIGIRDYMAKNRHNFDFGCESPLKLLVECKAHTWTKGDNVPSAKLTAWNEAMYYFFLAPKDYRKILFVQEDVSSKKNKSLAEYYFERCNHLIPDGVEIWDFDINKQRHKIIS